MADEEEFQITDQETANTQVPVSEAAITESAVLAEVSQEPEEIYVDVSGAVVSPGAVSYTHLDVYKRQYWYWPDPGN